MLKMRNVTCCCVQNIPLFLSRVRAGFPSPADDYLESSLDFNQYLVKHPAATYCVRVTGESMKGAGIGDGDILVVDRSITPKSRKIVIAVIDGELTVKRFIRKEGRLFLVPENPDFEPIEIKDPSCEIWGVVTHIIRHAE